MIVPTLAKLIIKEHLHKPIKGKVLCLGRQTITMTHKETVRLIKKEGIEISEEVLRETETEKDLSTRVGKGTEKITDVAFFKLLGITDMVVMDISDYEDADIIHDLNKPIPKSLENKFDFIIDGGTFDHLFDLRNVFINVNKMLKKGGRIFQWNAASNFVGSTYLSFGPHLFHDYYVVNQFEDTKVWIAEIRQQSQQKNWNIYEFEGIENSNSLITRKYLLVLVLAEKGKNTTFDKMPTQSHYRDRHLWDAYNAGKENISHSERKPLRGRLKYSFFGSTFGMLLRKLLKIEFLFHKGYRYVGYL